MQETLSGLAEPPRCYSFTPPWLMPTKAGSFLDKAPAFRVKVGVPGQFPCLPPGTAAPGSWCG